MFIKMVLEAAFSFHNILQITKAALNHVDNNKQPHLTTSYHVTSVYYFTVAYILYIRGFS